MALSQTQQQIADNLSKGVGINVTANPAASQYKENNQVTASDIQNTANKTHQAGQGFIIRFVSWFYHSIVHLADSFKDDIVQFIHTSIFKDIEKYSLDALNVLPQLFMGGMSFSGPTTAEGAEQNRILSFIKGNGMGLLSGVVNVAGSIPSLGQVSNVGQTLMSMNQNSGMGGQNEKMANATIDEHVNKPLQSVAREEAQSQTLSVDEIKESNSRGLLSEAEFGNQMHDLGYPDEMHPVMNELSKTPLDANQVSEMLQNKVMSNEEAMLALRQNGYKDADIVRLIKNQDNSDFVKMEKELQAMLVEMHGQNKIGDDQFKQLLVNMGVEEKSIEKIANSSTNSQIVKGINDETNRLIDLYKSGQIGQDEIASGLKQLELSDQSITKIMQDVENSINSSNASDVLVSLNRSFQAGLIEEDKYINELTKIGVNEDKVTTLLSEAQKNTALNGGKLKDNGQLEQTFINISYAEGHITEEEFVSMSMFLGTTMEKVDVLKSELKRSNINSNNIMPIKNIEEAVMYMTISDSEAYTFLTNNGFSPTQIQILVDTWKKKATSLGIDTTTSKGVANNSINISSGVNTDAISATNYDNIMNALGIASPTIHSLLGMFYRSLIEAGMISQAFGEKQLTGIGIDLTTARELIG